MDKNLPWLCWLVGCVVRFHSRREATRHSTRAFVTHTVMRRVSSPTSQNHHGTGTCVDGRVTGAQWPTIQSHFPNVRACDGQSLRSPTPVTTRVEGLLHVEETSSGFKTRVSRFVMRTFAILTRRENRRRSGHTPGTLGNYPQHQIVSYPSWKGVSSLNVYRCIDFQGRRRTPTALSCRQWNQPRPLAPFYDGYNLVLRIFAQFLAVGTERKNKGISNRDFGQGT